MGRCLTARRLLAGLQLGDQGGELVDDRAEAIVNRPLDNGGDPGLKLVKCGVRRHPSGAVTRGRSELYNRNAVFVDRTTD